MRAHTTSQVRVISKAADNEQGSPTQRPSAPRRPFNRTHSGMITYWLDAGKEGHQISTILHGTEASGTTVCGVTDHVLCTVVVYCNVLCAVKRPVCINTMGVKGHASCRRGAAGTFAIFLHRSSYHALLKRIAQDSHGNFANDRQEVCC